MRGVQHLCITGVCLFYMKPGISFIAASMLASVLPDSDIKSAPIAHIIPLWLILKKRKLSYIDRTGTHRTVFTKHRTITHSLFFGLIFSVLGLFINYKFACGIMFGYGLHLLCDSTSVTGIPYLWWYPGKKKES